MTLRKSISVWILGFLTFLTALCSFAVTIYWINEGPNFILRPLLFAGIISDLVGDLTVQLYLWALLTATFVFFGLTCLFAYKKAPPDPEMLRMFVKIGGNLVALKTNQDGMATELSERIETGKQISREYFKKIDTNFEQSKEEMFTALHNHEKIIQKSRRELSSIFGTKLAKSRDEMLSVLRKQEKTMDETRFLNKQSASALKEQVTELDNIQIRLDKIAQKIDYKTQPKLKSKDAPEKIKGIGPRLVKELKQMGVANVGELITADPLVIEKETRLSKEKAERLQATAQLLMIPSIDEIDAELLLDAEITSRRELADQELVQLSRKVSDITKTYVADGKISENEKPTMEEFSSWIRMAKYQLQ